MGYTHYWTPKRFTQLQWREYTTATKKLHANLPKSTDTAGGYHKNDPLEIAGGNGDGNPVFSERTMVDFNGKDELGHETFRIYADYQKNHGDFCKTARKPYDLLVVACLIAAYRILNFRFSSDGFRPDETCEDLQPAIDFYNNVLTPEVPVTQEELAKQRKESRD